jgi:hypothetical protein
MHGDSHPATLHFTTMPFTCRIRSDARGYLHARHGGSINMFPSLPRALLALLAALPVCLPLGCARGFTNTPVQTATPGKPFITSITLVDQSSDTSAGQGYVSGDTTPQGSLNYFISTGEIVLSSDFDTLKVVLRNSNVLPPGTNHMGAGDYYQGKVYSVAETWKGCQSLSSPLYIGVYDGTTLNREQAIDISSYTTEASGIAIVPELNQAFVSNYCDSENLYAFDLSTWRFLGTIPLNVSIDSIQGLAYRDGFVYIANTNGRLYALRISDNAVQLLTQFSMKGEYEGLDFHTGQLRWLVNMVDGTHILYSFDLVQ